MGAFRDWQLTSAGLQQRFYDQFGDRRWDLIETEDPNTMKTKLSYALYGLQFSDLTCDQKSSLEETRNKVIELSGSGKYIHIGYVFVSIRLKESTEQSIVPLISTKPTYGDEVFFVEEQPGRVYTGWEDFLAKNNLPKCDMCYPENGFYETLFNGRVRVQFRESPSCNKLFNVLDVVSTIGKAASVGVIGVSSFFPIIAPITIGATTLLGATTVYTTTKNITLLVDRMAHHESVGLLNANSRSLWIGVGTHVIGLVLIGGAAIIPRLMAGGRLAACMGSTMLETLSWGSVAVGGFGVLANLVILIMKLRENVTLQSCDISYFVSCCFFISNLILNPFIAERIIRMLCNEPSQLCNFLQMTSNTAYNTVKGIVSNLNFEAAVKIILGNNVTMFLKSLDMQYTETIVQSVGTALRKFRRGVIGAVSLIFKLFRLLKDHLNDFLMEVIEAWNIMRKFVINLQGRFLFKMPNISAIEVINCAERVLDQVDVVDSDMRENLCYNLINLATQLAQSSNVQNEEQFAQVCQIVMNDIILKCNQRMVLSNSSQGFLSSTDRHQILDEVIGELRNKLEPVPVLSTVNNSILPNNQISLKQLYYGEEYSIHVFDTSREVGVFDQFIYDAACQLLGDDNFLEHCSLDVGKEQVIMIQSLGQTIIFTYKYYVENLETALIMVFLRI